MKTEFTEGPWKVYAYDSGEYAKTICGLAKQMINNEDVILRTDKLVSTGMIKNGAIKPLVGGYDDAEAKK